MTATDRLRGCGRVARAAFAVLLVAAPGAAAQVPEDLEPPASSASAPAYAVSSPIEVAYTASDGAGSGVARVDLYARAPGELVYTLAATDPDPGTPSFSYAAAAGDGVYSFYTVAVDAAGNAELPPLAGDGDTTLDTAVPSSQASAPEVASQGPIDVAYDSADQGTGVAAVELWADGPGSGGWELAAVDADPATPEFAYEPAEGDGGYAFRTIAVDLAGNHEPPPDAADATVARDTVAPVSTDDVPLTAQAGPVTVTLTAADPGGVGVAATHYTTDGSAPDTSSPLYDPASPPTLDSGQSIRYFSVDRAGNAEAPKQSAALAVQPPPPAPPPPPPAAPAPPPAAPPPPPAPIAELVAPATPAAAPTLASRIVAALALRPGQTWRAVRARGLVLELYAARRVSATLELRLGLATARRIGLGRRTLIARRRISITTPAVYPIRLRAVPRARRPLRRLKRATVFLRYTLVSGAGSITSTSTIKLR